jgi:hypothetical protein
MGKMGIASFIIMLPRFNLWKVDNYVYALAALLGVAFVILSLKSNKTIASQNAKKEKKLAKLEKKQEKLKGQLENQEA